VEFKASCPKCGSKLLFKTAKYFGETRCWSCHSFLWFHGISKHIRLYDYDSHSHNIVIVESVLMRRLPSSRRLIQYFDSIDIVEVLLDLVEEFGKRKGLHRYLRFETVEDAIDFFLKC